MSSTPSSSAVGRVARSAWREVAAGWRQTASAARKRFAWRLIGVTAAAMGLSVGSALLLEGVAVDGLLPGDTALTEPMRGTMSVHSAVWVSGFTSSAMLIPMVAVAAVLWARVGRWERAATAAAALAASKAIVLAGWFTWARERPADVAGGELVQTVSSYPSGHTLQTWSVYGLFVLWWATATDRTWERVLAWSLLLVGSLILGVARVRIGAHHPSDVLGGLVLGAIWLAGAAWAERAVRAVRAE